ncbi:hypothetical protein [uncultured Desulfovibrio sp.]|uniref:hypothetical protein n=1 Tax=uncultured Desulfovibrio sp. TaxID=167968 RepID=UPI0025D2C117|nr:hypothetical protein [uncultured Desulfovibrio sp.]
MAEIYVKHKKTYVLVKFCGFWIYFWLFSLGVVFVLSLLSELSGSTTSIFSEPFSSSRGRSFWIGSAFALICFAGYKFVCKKLEHRIDG